jgi:hypothetical protein
MGSFELGVERGCLRLKGGLYSDAPAQIVDGSELTVTGNDVDTSNRGCAHEWLEITSRRGTVVGAGGGSRDEFPTLGLAGLPTLLTHMLRCSTFGNGQCALEPSLPVAQVSTPSPRSARGRHARELQPPRTARSRQSIGST